MSLGYSSLSECFERRSVFTERHIRGSNIGTEDVGRRRKDNLRITRNQLLISLAFKYVTEQKDPITEDL